MEIKLKKIESIGELKLEMHDWIDELLLDSLPDDTIELLKSKIRLYMIRQESIAVKKFINQHISPMLYLPHDKEYSEKALNKIYKDKRNKK